MYHGTVLLLKFLNQKELTPRFRLITVTDTVTIEPVVIRPASSSSSRTVKKQASSTSTVYITRLTTQWNPTLPPPS